ncbi:MAG: phosphotransferase [Clostridiales bacterium]|nr:phosphotransferase [Clostridiales bacterium]
MEFDGSQILIGRGAQADVFKYQGYAYKVYKNTYPEEWIRFEISQQETVVNLGLCDVRYYTTDDPHIIKMDLIEGIELEKKVLEGFLEGFDLLADAFRKVHQAKIPSDGIKMPRLIDTAGMGLSDEDREKIFPVITRLSEKYDPCVCHLDMHFLNIMLPDDGSEYKIIDWMNARIAPAIFDYARTYVIFDEFSQEGLELYKRAVASDIAALGITDADFKDAVMVSSVIRNREKKE